MHKMLAVLVLTVAVFSGCMTTPAIGGRTHAIVEFYDVVPTVTDPVSGEVIQGQDTRFSINVKAPAGVEIEELVNMAYKWNTEEGTGEIAVSKEGDLSTEKQAEMIPQVAQIQAQMISAAISGALQTLVSVAPQLSQVLQAQIAADASTASASTTSTANPNLTAILQSLSTNLATLQGLANK